MSDGTPFSTEFSSPSFNDGCDDCGPGGSHCNHCCPWYPAKCESTFSPQFGGGGFGCNHDSCVTPDHKTGELLQHGEMYPWECLPWAADTSCCDEFPSYDEALQNRALTLAWDTIRVLTGGRVAAGCSTLRPCLSEKPCDDCWGQWMDKLDPATGGLFQPTLYNGQWYNMPPCRPKDCSCCSVCEIKMPARVAALLEVNIDGYRHDPRLFRIDDGHNLVRQDGCCWPSCQNLGAPYGYYGTFGIKYVPGIVPNAAGLWAVGVLACEYAKACSGGKCRLPSSVTSISRQGITMELTSGMFDNGTGIREVDAYIHSVNPNALKLPSRVWSPDQPAHRATTGGPTGTWP